MHPSVEIFDKAANEAIHTTFEIEMVANDCRFTEGPVWNSNGYYSFSDITANTIYRLVPGRKKEALITNSGTANPEDKWIKQDMAGANGLAYDTAGNLLVCRHGSHMVARWSGKELKPFITSYQNKPFNSPNDITVDSRGRIFFSDPPYGLKEGKPNTTVFQPVAGVYCFENGEAFLFCDKYQYPNGVCLSPGEKRLYICSNKPFEKFISVYDAATLQFQKILAEENSDGIKCDPAGNVFLSNKDGILILNPEGQRLALIRFPTIPANHCFGGPGKKDLFVTARENVFLIRNLLK